MYDMDDTRNVVDEFKGVPHDEIMRRLNERGVDLEIAVENLERDFNMGTIVRTANAFGIRNVHIIGSRQWNKRGAMMTDKYLEVVYHASVTNFVRSLTSSGAIVVAVDNVAGSVDIRHAKKPVKAVLVFGAEGPGLSDEMLTASNTIVAIPQLGSTRSLNVGVAAGIAMWEWLRES